MIGIQGLDSGAVASVRITGPGGFMQQVAQSTTLWDLAPGSYAVLATRVKANRGLLVPIPSGQVGRVTAGSTTGLLVSYLPLSDSSGFNLRIDGLYLTQAVQRYDGSVPLVAGRKAYLRVFAVGTRAVPLKPRVRIHLYRYGDLMRTLDVPPPSRGVPDQVSEGDLGTSWNLMIPEEYILPGLRVMADIDPENAIPEVDEADNRFPLSGSPQPLVVRSVPAFDVRFVPVFTQTNGRLGKVTLANAEQFLTDLKVLLPVGRYSLDLRTPYTTSARPLQSNNANGAWGALLSELLALRLADRSARHYYGVVDPAYSAGTAGIGFIGGDRPAALGWDRLPSASYVMAHEMAHNFGRSHAPCRAPNPDRSFPYPGGRIGVWGFDPTWFTVKSPATWADVTGYCNPYWVSDYSWEAMMAYRTRSPALAGEPPADPPAGSGLLVWGRITPEGPVLEPAFSLDRPGELPVPGPHRLRALAGDGTTVFSVSFAASPVADLPTGSEEAFAFVLPAGPAFERITQLRLEAKGENAVRRREREAPPALPAARDLTARSGRLTWDAAQHPMVMVRDPVTGEVLSFARGGELQLPLTRNGVELHFSDGIRSRMFRL